MSTAAPATPALKRADPPSELKAAQLAGDGLSFAQIAARFDPPLSVEQARIAIVRGRHQLAQRAQSTVTAIADSVPSPSQPAPEPNGDIEQLLTWAETDGPQRAVTLAARTRAQLAELGALKESDRLAAKARKKVEAAEKALAAAKAELRQITSSASTVVVANAQRLDVSPKTVREWALANGHTVSPIGRIPQPVMAAYVAAHAEGGES